MRVYDVITSTTVSIFGTRFFKIQILGSLTIGTDFKI